MTKTFTVTDPKTGKAIEYQSAPICGFWRRIVALGLDMLLLAILGWFLSLFLSSQFIQMGVYGRLLGFGIALIYFGILNSRIGNGQSIGKRVMQIKVVDRAGELLPPLTALIRGFFLFLPFLLNGLIVPPSSFSTLFSGAITIILFSLGCSGVYLYLFNRNSRQSIHDLICKTYVVRENLSGPVYTEKVSRIHYIILALIIVLGLALPIVLKFSGSSSVLARIERLQLKIMEINRGIHCVANEGINYNSGKTTKYLLVTVFVKNSDNWEALADSIAHYVLTVPAYVTKDYIGIIINYGYDIGIYSSFSRQSYWDTPQEWCKRVK